MLSARPRGLSLHVRPPSIPVTNEAPNVSAGIANHGVVAPGVVNEKGVLVTVPDMLHRIASGLGRRATRGFAIPSPDIAIDLQLKERVTTSGNLGGSRTGIDQ